MENIRIDRFGKFNKFNKEFIITLDLDWVSDEIANFVIDLFIHNNIKATWFITHKSKAVQRLIDNKVLFEIGIHPNLLLGSTQGKSNKSVFANLFNIYPRAKIMRTHSLCQSSFLFKFITEECPQIKIDVSLFLPGFRGDNIYKYYFSHDKPSRFLYRVPYFWDDNFEILSREKILSFNMNNYLWRGFKIFNFHPIHIVLNSFRMKEFNMLSKKYSIKSCALEEVLKFRNNSVEGVHDFLTELISAKNASFLGFKDLVNI